MQAEASETVTSALTKERPYDDAENYFLAHLKEITYGRNKEHLSESARSDGGG